MFQNLRQGNTLYVLDKSDVPVLRIGEVVSVGNPTPVYNTQTAGLTIGMQPKMEISIRCRVDGKEGDFAHLPIEQNVHDYGDMLVADSREAMLSEVDNLKQRAQAVLDKVEYSKATITACGEMFKTLNPNYAKEQERDEAITSLSDRLNGIESSITQILKTLNKK
jgi:hypothetical protein